MHKSFCLSDLRLDGVPPGREVRQLLRLPLSLGVLLLRRQGAPQGTGALGAEVARQVLAVGVELAQLSALGLADHGLDAGNGLAHALDLADLGRVGVADLRNAQRRQLGLELGELGEQVRLAGRAELASLDLAGL